ncbi:hypothetical protein [Nonomuraea glycinis]|uniref:hypothetical protein n=1 Tax=Nonomuraea glycinis TaxID=2047744 RepID=UPI0033BD45B0
MAIIKDLQARVKSLELKVGMRAVTFSALAASVSTTSFTAVAFTVIPRSGSSLAVDVNVAGAAEVQLTVEGVSIGAATAAAAGTVTVSGFLPASWAFGDRKRVEVQARRTSGTGALAVAVLSAWHR